MLTNYNAETEYLKALKETKHFGTLSANRTKDKAIVAPYPVVICHDWISGGFPLLTTKKMSIKNIATELEFFIGGLTDKRWLQERNCHIWDSWANRYSIGDLTPDTKYYELVKQNPDLGPIYGYQWRRFGKEYKGIVSEKFPLLDGTVEELMAIGDQLGSLWVKLRKGYHHDRRMHVSAWNPLMIDKMALPPCHLSFTVSVVDGILNLSWFQRSADAFLGVPYNIASYALLQYLLAKGSGLEIGRLTGVFQNFHIYEQHMEQVDQQLSRVPLDPPTLLNKTNELFDWTADDVSIEEYLSYSTIKGRVSA